MKINVKILLSGSWVKCVCFIRNGKQFIAVEITNKEKKMFKKNGENDCKVLRHIAATPQQQDGFGSQ